MRAVCGWRTGGIQAGERRHIVGCELVRIRVADRDRHAGNRIHKVHNGKAGIVVRRRMRIAGDHVQIHLRPTQPDHAAEHSHQPVFDVGELRRLQRTLAVDDYQRVEKICACAEVVHAAIDGVPEALRGIARACSEQGVSDRTVVVVDNSHRSLSG